MMWHKCNHIMPGEAYDVAKNPEARVSHFLVCYHNGDKDLINPELQVKEAILIDGKFLCNGALNGWENAIFTHWMLIELP